MHSICPLAIDLYFFAIDVIESVVSFTQLINIMRLFNFFNIFLALLYLNNDGTTILTNTTLYCMKIIISMVVSVANDDENE